MTEIEYTIESIEELDALAEKDESLQTPYSVLAEYPGIDDETRRRALAFLNEWQGWQYGYAPSVVAATAVFYANQSKDRWTQEKVADIFGVTINSMRSLWRTVQDEVDTETLRELEIGHYS